MLHRPKLLILCSLLAGAMCSSANAATRFVSPCGNNAWAGVQPVCAAPLGPKRTIQAAINASSNGDSVHVLPGTYVETIDLDGKAITLLGTNGAAFTIIDGNGGGPVVLCNSLEGPGTIVRGFTIQNGNAATGGGMFVALANPTIEECVFSDNFADDAGGGVACIAASPTITDCDFISNEADVGGADADGHGAGMSIAGGSPTVSGCLFLTNHAQNYGGGMSISGGATPLTIEDCTFHENAQWTYCVSGSCSPPNAGAAVASLDSAPMFSGCMFDMNYLGGHGAAVVDGGTASFTGCTFTDNRAAFDNWPDLEGGGLGVQGGAGVTLFGCSFTNNISNGDGGEVHVKDSTLTATLCGFTGNTTVFEEGGAICGEDASIILGGCTFAGNIASTDGGAIAASDGSLSLEGCSFTNNGTGTNIEASGGAVRMFDGLLQATSCTFSGNSAYWHGGAVSYNPGHPSLPGDPSMPDVTIDDCEFTGNGAWYGGGLSVSWCIARVEDSVFDSNIAESPLGNGAGGGVSIGHAAVARLKSTQFLSNTAADFGGGLAFFGNGEAVGCTFTSNSARNGGGVNSVSNNTRPSLISCRFNLNTATESGSAVDMGLLSGMNLVNCIIDHNTAPAGRGAVTAGESGQALEITNCTIANNVGGGVWVSDAGTVALIANSIVWGNSSGAQIAAAQATVGYSDVQGGYTGTGNINANPVFLGALGGNYRLNPASPAIDAGRNMALPQDSVDLDADSNMLELLPLDFDGNPRFTDNTGKANTGCGGASIVDMGAFETAGVGAVELMPGDANGDGFVNFADITFVLTNWGLCTPCCPGDVNANGEVSFSDITEVLTYWGLVG